MKEANSNDNYDAQTLLLNDSNGNELFCYLEQLVSVEGQEYALLTPVDTPVSLFKINEKDEPELIEKIENEENTIQHEQDSIPKENVGKIKPCLVTPYVITTEKEQTLEEAIRLTKVEYSNPLELIEKIENEEKTIQKKADLDS